MKPEVLNPFNHLTVKPFNPIAAAFTMAEILISLTIIGIIAAITLPALQANINEKTWATQRKALYSRMSQAIALMPSVNGYGVSFNEDGTINEDETASKAAQAFINDGLSKVLKIDNICDNANLQKCGFPKKIKKADTHTKLNTPTAIRDIGTVYGINVNTRAAAFETKNGESIVALYYPFCQSGLEPDEYIGGKMCVNLIYDLNGLKGPNAYGKDIGFITVLYPTDSSVVMPIIDINNSLKLQNQQGAQNLNWRNALKFCRSYGQKLPNIEELVSLMLNCNFTNNCSGGHWSSTPISPGYSYGCSNGRLEKYTIQTATLVKCIKR